MTMRPIDTMTMDRDPGVQEATRAVEAAQRVLDEAVATRSRLTPATTGQAVLDLEVLSADQLIRRATATRDAAAREATAAETAARARIVSARQPARLALWRRLLDAAEAARTLAIEVRDYEAAPAAAVGLVPGPHPLPMLLGLAGALDRFRQDLAGPRPEPALPPPGPGRVRVDIRGLFVDPTWGRRYPGRCDLDQAVADEAIQKGWAVPA